MKANGLIIIMAIVATLHSLALAVQQPHDPIVVDSRVMAMERARINAVRNALPASVCVFAPSGNGGGSGVVISPDGFALTNYHVVKPCGEYMNCSMADGNLYDAVLVGLDPTGDVALIKLLGRDDFPVAKLGDSDKVRVGQWCFAVGNPFLLATDFQPTVSWGVVSGVRRYQYPAGTLLEYADCIQTDAAINPGNSGGPLFNDQSELIGINGRGSFEKRGRINVGVGYAISINQIKHFMDHLHSGRIVDHATLGATVATTDGGRVVVNNILESCDAYRRGLRIDDEIVKFGGRRIESVNQFKNVLGIYPKGWRVPVSFRRNGNTHQINVTLEPLHDSVELADLVNGKLQKPNVPQEPDDKNPEPKEPRHPRLVKQEPIPEDAAKLIEKRIGFANYYFNRVARDRIWKDNLTALGADDTFKGKWVLAGKFVDESAVRIVLDERISGIQFGDRNVIFDQEKDVDSQFEGSDIDGVLVALHLWRKLYGTGPDKFGDVYYLGSLPDDLTGTKLQVLVAVWDVVNSNFMFDPQSSWLSKLEVSSASGVDPLVLRFENYELVDGIKFPKVLSIERGDNFRMEIHLEKVEFKE